MEYLVALAAVLGFLVSSAIMLIIVIIAERIHNRKHEIYYVYQTRIEKASDLHRRRGK